MAALGLAAALATPAPAQGKRAPQAALEWKGCGEGFQCARLAVPRDWDRPRNGKRLKLSLIRLPASAKKPAGSLLVNFGGPGASGVSSLRGAGKLLREATGGKLHIVSWDPRGVGESAPIRCPQGNEAFYNADPFTEAGRAQMAHAVAARARACAARYGDYLEDIGTDQTVRDLDAIRAAVGDPKVNFLGLSYGTRVGAVYSQTFPRRIRTMVLDGAMPPISTTKDVAEGLAVSFEGALNEYFRLCNRAPRCALGDDPAAGFDALVAQIRNDPPEVPGSGGRRLTIGLFYQVVLALIINYQGSSQVAAEVIGEYRKSGDPTNLYKLASVIAGDRQPDGSYATNGTETFQFINCLDWEDRPTPAQVSAVARAAEEFAPRLGPFGVTFVYMNQSACPRAAKPVPPPAAASVPPILVVGNDNDAETPLINGQQLSATLPGSRLLVWRGLGHTAITTSPCVARLAGRYLVTRKLPPVGTFCPNLPVIK